MKKKDDQKITIQSSMQPREPVKRTDPKSKKNTKIKKESQRDYNVTMAADKTPMHSGFECPTYGETIPEGYVLKKMPNGLLKIVPEAGTARKKQEKKEKA